MFSNNREPRMLNLRRAPMNNPPNNNSEGEEQAKSAATARDMNRGGAQRRRQQLFNEAYLATPPEQRQDFFDAMAKEWSYHSPVQPAAGRVEEWSIARNHSPSRPSKALLWRAW